MAPSGKLPAQGAGSSKGHGSKGGGRGGSKAPKPTKRVSMAQHAKRDTDNYNG